MALLNVASDLQTRQTVWVSRSVRTGEQIHHNGEILALPAADIAGLATHYRGPQDR